MKIFYDGEEQDIDMELMSHLFNIKLQAVFGYNFRFNAKDLTQFFLCLGLLDSS